MRAGAAEGKTAEDFFVAQEEDCDMDNEKAAPRGIGGWLILLMLGILFSLYRYAVDIAQGVAEIARNPQAPNQDLVEYGLAVEILLFAAWIVAAVLMLQHKRVFPKFYISIVAVLILYSGLSIWAGIEHYGLTYTPEEIANGLVAPLVNIVIWTPYLFLSKRVRNTFTR
jgi:Protein of unknown function (DUF2569)